MTALETALTGLSLGTPVTHANLTLFPLLGGDAGEPAYLTLGEALAAGHARITEVSEQGSSRRKSWFPSVWPNWPGGRISRNRRWRMCSGFYPTWRACPLTHP